jgi:type III secretion protein L
MASLFRISPENIQAAPDSRLIKATEWARYCSAVEITEQARQYAEDLRQEARMAFDAEKKRGFAEGLREGRAEHAENMMETVLKSIEYIEGLEKGIVSLVSDALRKILGELPPEERIVGVVRQALNLVRGQKKVVLSVPPEDEPLAQGKLKEILSRHPSIDFVDVRADGRLAPGACLLQSEMGVIDAGLETQIQAITNALKKRQSG